MKTREKSWWWKLDANNDYRLDEVFPRPNEFQRAIHLESWEMGGEWAAFSYEMARRHGKTQLPGYPELNHGQCLFLLELFGKSRGARVNTVWLPPLAKIEWEQGYSWVSMWRLDLPDNTLKASFMKFIEQQRALHGVTPKKQPSETSKSPPWNWCELLDRGGKTSRGLRLARARAAECHKKLFEAVEKEPENRRRSICFTK